MQVIESIHEMQSVAVSYRTQGRLIGFVPTMGYLHEGHLALVDLAKEKADLVVVSIFVNPVQFGPAEDYERYPRNPEQDRLLCEERGVDILFVPKREELYPDDYSVYLEEKKYSKGLCGVSRPHFFRGVTTVVAKLFNIVRPDLAVFGQKDAQQAAVIKKLVRDLHFPVEIEVGPTVREADGLAMSSRNAYLNEMQRRDAVVLHEALEIARKMISEDGVRIVNRVQAEITHHLSQVRRVRMIYVEIVDPDTMEPLREIVPGGTLIAVAAWVDEVRMIDNLLI